jgi:flagellar hook protein FlgE
MYSGVSGLLSHQKKMDVIGNNIANVNTTAFKSSNIVFEELFSQLVASAAQPTENGRGGINPQQIGLGVSIGNVTTNMSKGSIQATDNPNDLAIDGEGFFVVTDGSGIYYTRAGSFNVDKDGNLVNGSGYKVMGWNKNHSTGNIDTSKPTEPVDFSNLKMQARSTAKITVTGNISSETLEYDALNDENAALHNLTIYDSLGESHTVTFKFMKSATPNSYTFALTESDDFMSISSGATGGTLAFSTSGKLSTSESTIPEVQISFTNGADSITFPTGSITFDPVGFTQYSNSTSIKSSQDGYTSGELETLSISSDGMIIGQFTNGLQEHISTLAISSFITVYRKLAETCFVLLGTQVKQMSEWQTLVTEVQ